MDRSALFFHSEAKLFLKARLIQTCSNFYLFYCNTGGGLPVGNCTNDEGVNLLISFVSYNLAHANLLQEILDVAPLTVGKVKRIIEQMDSKVMIY